MNEMSEENGAKEVNKYQPPKYLNKKWALLAGVLALPLDFFFDHRGDPGRAMAAGCSGTVFILAIRYRWDLRNQTWFWVTITFVVLLHVPVLLLFQWPDTHLPAIGLIPFLMLDYIVICGCVRLVEKAIKKDDRDFWI